jgi:hypothetical protein
MTISSNRRYQFDPLFDVHPETGASIEIFWANAMSGKVGARWF